MNFSYETRDVRVVFGMGTLVRIAEELERMGLKRVMLLTTPGRMEDREDVLTLLGARLAGEYNGARLHVPLEVVADARAALDHFRPDSLLAFGGGSAIGLGKALAYETKLP